MTFTLTPDPTPAPARVFTKSTGREAQRVGKSFQDWVEQCAATQRAILELEGLPDFGARKVFDPKKKQSITITTPICCDYIGCFVKDGVSVFFDAKSTDATSAFNVQKMVYTRPHQLKFLRRMWRANAVAGYLIDAREVGEYLWLPAGEILDEQPIRFAHAGKLAKQFTSLGSRSGPINFTLLRNAYFNPEATASR